MAEALAEATTNQKNDPATSTSQKLQTVLDVAPAVASACFTTRGAAELCRTLYDRCTFMMSGQQETTPGRIQRPGCTKGGGRREAEDGENEGMKKEALNVCVKTDDFPFNTPLSSLLSSVLPAAVTAPQLSSFHNNNPQIIQPHTHTHTPPSCSHTPKCRRHKGSCQVITRSTGCWVGVGKAEQQTSPTHASLRSSRSGP